VARFHNKGANFLSVFWQYRNNYSSSGTQNKLAQTVALVSGIREVLDSNLGLVTDYPEVLSGSSEFLEANGWSSTSDLPRPLPSTFFPIHCSLTILSSDAIQFEIRGEIYIFVPLCDCLLIHKHWHGKAYLVYVSRMASFT
jgi:hypothetical protein